MYSSNHSVRYCSIFEPPHYSHSDGITKPKQAYGYDPEGAVRVLCRAACTHSHTQTHTHAHFPKVKQMPNMIFPTRDKQSLMSQVIPSGWWPSPHPSGCYRFMHQHSSDTHTHTHAHTLTLTPVSNTAICQQYHMREPGSFILCQDCIV